MTNEAETEITREVFTEGEMRLALANGLPVTIFQECVGVQLGSHMTKYIALVDFVKMFSNAVQASQASAMEAISYPEGVYAVGRQADGICVGLYRRGGMRDVLYEYYESGRVPRKMPAPNVVVNLKLAQRSDGWFVESSRYFCTDKTFGQLGSEIHMSPNPSARMWLLPYTNMYEGGDMCFGANSMPRVFPTDNLRGLAYYVDVIWASPFNNDLGVKSAIQEYRGNPESWYNLLAEYGERGEPFPYEKLKDYTPRA